MTRQARLLGAALGAGLLLGLGAAHAVLAGPPAASPDDAITELDLDLAERLLDRAIGGGTAAGIARARLAIYRGACDTAAAQLSSPALAETKDGAALREIAETCAGATAAGFVVEDRERGVFLRLQDDADRVLAPFLFDVIAKARDEIGRSLGAHLPRPVRVDLVRDLFSLSAVSGLPLTAAETTGTLAVARWGKVIMLSPRATPAGYPWQDTLAHELTHLFVTRATRDQAPLWLQEGIAKREESRWRPARPFDDPTWADALALSALESARSVGIGNLGPSIAMLPTPEAASTAYAEVASFAKHWIEIGGQPALRLLFVDLKGVGRTGVDSALKSTSGYSLSEWNRRWQAALLAVPPRDPRAERAQHPPLADPRAFARRMRLGDLLAERGALRPALEQYEAALELGPNEASARFRSTRTALLAGETDALEKRLGTVTELRGPHGGWLALEGRRAQVGGRGADAERAFDHALGLDPYSSAVACEGELSAPGGGAPSAPARAPDKQRLCEEARKHRD